MSDITERLRREAMYTSYKPNKPWDMLVEAADTIDTLRAELAAANRLASDRLDQMTADRAQALRWRDEAEACKADAGRYRWLRDGCDLKDSPATRIAARLYGLEWDAAIDAAMKGGTNAD